MAERQEPPVGSDPAPGDRPQAESLFSAPPISNGRPSPLLLVVGTVVAVVTMGFLAGSRRSEAPSVAGLAKGMGQAPDAVTIAPSYSDLRGRRWGSNADMYANQVRDLALSAPTPADQISRPTPEQKQAALTARAERRAYAGAPPVIPHAIDQTALPGCLGCHEKGAVAAGRIAPAMSHRRFENCLQCHVPASSPPPLRDEPRTSNTFVGMPSPTGGERAWPGAPPVIPHRTFMRETCASCHGVAGLTGVRATHPWRQSCTQCHAASALLDQRVSIAQ